MPLHSKSAILCRG